MTHVRKPDPYETKLNLAEICRLGFHHEPSKSRGSREIKKHKQAFLLAVKYLCIYFIENANRQV